MSEKKTLVQKLISIYEKIDHIDKRGKNNSPGQGNYAYVKATDLAHAVRKALLELNIYAEVNFQHESQYTIARAEGKSPFTANDVTCTIIFHDGDSGETINSSGLGTGADMSDKAIYKAQTGALKYALRNAFLVPDEADPEATEDEPEQQTRSTARPNNPPKNEKAPPPEKAQIPNESKSSSGSNSQENSGSHVSVTPEEYEKYRQRFTKVVDELTTLKGGLKSDKGAPIGHKVRAFLLEDTGQSKPEEMSVAQWENVFVRVNAITNEGGLKPLVDAVNAAFGGKNE